MRPLAVVLAVVLTVSACPRQQAGQQTSTAAVPVQTPALTVTLVRSDLGLGDGEFVRETDALLSELAEDGWPTYLPVGPRPAALTLEAGSGDVGLPRPGLTGPGEMDIAEGEALLAGVTDTDWLVLSSPRLLDAALARISAGEISAELILVLDEDGLGELAGDLPVPVYALSYDIRPVAFLCGVVAAASSNNGMFTIMAAETDPRAQDFLDGAWAGAKYQTNGAVAADLILPIDPEFGLITPETYRRMHTALIEEMGPYFASNHYIIALGRATPSILHAMSQEPISGYVVGAYADYRAVRPARVLGCALKHPGAALRYVLEERRAGRQLAELADERGLIRVGVDQRAVGFTDFDLYTRHNPDGDDLAEAVSSVWAEISVGELDVAELIEQYLESDAESETAPADGTD